MMYAQVNVYRGRERWVLAAMLREPGRPFPRTIRQVFRREVSEDPSLPLDEALVQAALQLLEMAAQMRGHDGDVGAVPGAPGGGGGDTPLGLD